MESRDEERVPKVVMVGREHPFICWTVGTVRNATGGRKRQTSLYKEIMVAKKYLHREFDELSLLVKERRKLTKTG